MAEKKNIRNIMLIGFMGAGKTFTGRELARIMGMRFIDMDEIIVKKAGMSINEIFSRYGEERFRDIETEVLKEISDKDGMVVGCGGGVIVKDRNLPLLKKAGIVIFLKASPEVIYERVKDDNSRPLLNVDDPIRRIKELLARRMDRYLNVAEITIDTDGKTPLEVAEEIKQVLEK